VLVALMEMSTIKWHTRVVTNALVMSGLERKITTSHCVWLCS
jgi:hypothetical protein